MSLAVVDSSVLLAMAKGEPLDQSAPSIVAGGVMSTVSLAEVYSKLNEWGIAHQDRWLIAAIDRIEPFSLSQARIAGDLLKRTAGAGLSLGDRACLALALELGAEVYTTDRAWMRVNVGCKVHLLR